MRKWVRAFKDGRNNVHNEPQSGRPSVDKQDVITAVQYGTGSKKFSLVLLLKEGLGGKHFATVDEGKRSK